MKLKANICLNKLSRVGGGGGVGVGLVGGGVAGEIGNKAISASKLKLKRSLAIVFIWIFLYH